MGRVNALTYTRPTPLLRHRGEAEIFLKPLPAKGNRRRLGLLSQCLALVVGVAPHPNPYVLPHPHAAGLPSSCLAPVTLSFQLAMSSSPLSLASSVPSVPSFRDEECGGGDLPELTRFGDQHPSPPWDSDADKCLSELASLQPRLLTPPPSPPSSSRAPTSPTPVSPPCRPHVPSTPYQVALETVEEALMCAVVPPPSPTQTPKYVPKDPPTPSKTTVHGPYGAKRLQLIRENHGGGVEYFVDGALTAE